MASRPSQAPRFEVGAGAQHERNSAVPTLDATLPGEPDPPAHAPGPPERLERFGRYVVLGVLGKGGMGVVLKGYDEELDRQVAIKVLHEHFGERHTARLRREAQAMAQLSHPNVAQVYEVGQLRGRTFVAMELVRGRTVQAWMEQQPRPSWRACVEVFLQLGEGLSAAHAKGLVHRDFKPSNAIVDDDGRARVLDFGLVRRRDDDDVTGAEHGDSEPALPDEPWDSATKGGSLTKTGSILGTPAYMSLEQVHGRGVDARSDQFSFCVALYEAVYGQRPYEGDALTSLLVSMKSGAVRSVPKGSRVPAALRKILLRGLASAPEQRWPSMDVLLTKLRALIVPATRRGVMLSAALVIVGLGGSWAFAHYVEVKERCTGAAAKLAGIWDEAHRQQLEAAVLGTQLLYAPDTWARVEPRLDRYAEAWASEHTAVCEATAVRGEQSPEVMDLRMGCLDENRAALRTAVQILAEADAKTVENAVELVAGLPDSARCRDVEALRAEVAPPEDAQVARDVAALRERLAALEARWRAGHANPVLLEEVGPLVERAESLGYGPLVAAAKRARGSLLSKGGRYQEAEEELLEAYSMSMRHRYDQGALEAASALTFVVGVGRARHAEGRLWGRTAVGHAERAGDLARLADALSKLGVVLDDQGDHAAAQQDLERSLRLREEVQGADHPDVASSLTNLGATFYGRGEYAQAQRYWERALEIWEEALGPQHPDVALVLSNLGAAHLSQGQLDRAEVYFERALRLEEQILGPEHLDVARSINNLGALAARRGRYDRAQRYWERALELKREALGPDHPEVATALFNVGTALQNQGDLERARRALEQAVQIHENALGPDHVQVALDLGMLADLARISGDLDTARTLGERAVAALESADVPPETLASVRFDLARSLGSAPEEQARARTLALQARETLRLAEGVQEGDLAEIERWLAEHPQP